MAKDKNQPVPSLSPVLKWAGGKRWLLPQLFQIYNTLDADRLVEPFSGGLAVALGLQPKKALLNDMNPHLINFYLQIKKGLKISAKMKNEREFFYAQREKFNKLVSDGKQDSKQAAEIFYYLNRTAFNGLCRFNSKGGFNVPFGKYSKINYLSEFDAYTERFKKWKFSCGDFSKLKICEGDFLYVDPPYDVPFTKYSKEDFNWKDQQRLVEWLCSFKIPMVVSNQATDRILKLYKKAGFEVRTISAPRRISCTGDRSNALEMLATRNV